MAFPASNNALSSAYAQIKQRASSVKSQAVALRNQSAAGPVSAEDILAYGRAINSARSSMTALATTPGLAAYAQEQENNPGLDIVAEYNAMVAQMDFTTSWIADNIPKDGDGYALILQISPNGSVVWRSFAPAATESLRTTLSALIATVA